MNKAPNREWLLGWAKGYSYAALGKSKNVNKWPKDKLLRFYKFMTGLRRIK